jgi:hypothetical protein
MKACCFDLARKYPWTVEVSVLQEVCFTGQGIFRFCNKEELIVKVSHHQKYLRRPSSRILVIKAS